MYLPDNTKVIRTPVPQTGVGGPAGPGSHPNRPARPVVPDCLGGERSSRKRQIEIETETVLRQLVASE
jgi:hypothetical protein